MTKFIKWSTFFGSILGTLIQLSFNTEYPLWVWILIIVFFIISCIGFIYDKFFKSNDKTKKVLFIDDEIEDFPIINSLKNNNYEIDTLKDVENISDERIKAAKIIFVDYKGVGKSFGKKQGVDLMKALRRKYPKKTIILFSAHKGFGMDADFNIADEMINKSAPLADFMDIINKY